MQILNQHKAASHTWQFLQQHINQSLHALTGWAHPLPIAQLDDLRHTGSSETQTPAANDWDYVNYQWLHLSYLLWTHLHANTTWRDTHHDCPTMKTKITSSVCAANIRWIHTSYLLACIQHQSQQNCMLPSTCPENTINVIYQHASVGAEGWWSLSSTIWILIWPMQQAQLLAHSLEMQECSSNHDNAMSGYANMHLRIAHLHPQCHKWKHSWTPGQPCVQHPGRLDIRDVVERLPCKMNPIRVNLSKLQDI